jgi:hypothetical protein
LDCQIFFFKERAPRFIETAFAFAFGIAFGDAFGDAFALGLPGLLCDGLPRRTLNGLPAIERVERVGVQGRLSILVATLFRSVSPFRRGLWKKCSAWFL